MNALTRNRDGLLALALMLMLLLAVLFPFAAGLTYAGSGEGPHHILTYTTGKLTWDGGTVVAASGAAELSLFDAIYGNVQSDNGESVVAPGTQQRSVVRLKNDTGRAIRYVAVMYCIKEQDALPVLPALEGTGFADTASYPLPDGVTQAQVVRAVTGTVGGGQIQDFGVTWRWNYYDSDERDVVDTQLGDKAAFERADEVTAGLYIVVEDEGPTPVYPDWGDPDAGDENGNQDGDWPIYITPEAPKTGDSSHIGTYFVLMALSLLVLILLVLERRRERKR